MTAPQVAPRSHPEAQSQTWLQVLDAFGIPFLTYAEDGRRTYVSRAAQGFLAATPIGVTISQQADRIASVELRSPSRPLQIAEYSLVRELPGWTRGVVLAVYIGRRPFGAVVTIRLSADAWSREAGVPGLTQRESEVAQLIAAGLATKEIAVRLGVSAHTTRHHTERVFEKLGVRSRSSVAALLNSRRPA